MNDTSPAVEVAAGPRATSRPLAVNVGRAGFIPYLTRFYEALAAQGVGLDDEPFLTTGRWLKSRKASVRVLHFHWPESIWNIPPLRIQKHAGWVLRLPLIGRGVCVGVSAYRIARLFWFLRAARKQGLHRMWTMHNEEIHEGNEWLDDLGYRLMYSESDSIICHDEATLRMCAKRVRPGVQLIRMDQGNYVGWYPEPRPRSLVLRELGLREDLPVVCCLGGMRTYKGFDVACEAAALLSGSVQTIVAGRPLAGFDVEALRRLARRASGTVLLERRLSDQEFIDIASASELMLLPYRAITTSALLLSSLSLGRAVVASDLPYLREVLEMGAPAAGTLVRPSDPAALAAGVRAMLEVPADAREAAARSLASLFDWDRVVRPVVDAIKNWTVPGPADAGRDEEVPS